MGCLRRADDGFRIVCYPNYRQSRFWGRAHRLWARIFLSGVRRRLHRAFGAATRLEWHSWFGWNLSLYGDGLTGPNTTFNPPSFGALPFSQAVFLQGISWAFQDVGGFTAGNYVLSFYLGSRYYSGPFDGNQTVKALIDGNVIGTWTLTSFTPFALENAAFTVSTGGSHRLEFDGMNLGDHTAFVSDVSITTATPEPSSLMLFSTAGLGIAGILRRKLNL